MSPSTSEHGGFEVPLWRALAAFRAVALLYAGFMIAAGSRDYDRPRLGWAVLAVMAVWTVYAILTARRGSRVFLDADLAVAVGCLLATALVEDHGHIARGAATTPGLWVAGAVFGWGISGGRARGAVAATVLAAADLVVLLLSGRPLTDLSQSTVNGIVMLYLCGIVAGYISMLGRTAEARMARAVEIEAATRERERLARDIHDSVLQVLTLVRRRGDALGGEAAELGRLAGDQEVALRTLISGRTPPASDPASHPESHQADLRPLLSALESRTVTVSAPATPVHLPEGAAQEVRAAVAAALDNVRTHCPADTRVWILVEDDGLGAVTVSVRDEGQGIPAGRLEEAASSGRLGVAQSIQGRIRDLGGTVTIASAPGQGTEIEMTVPALADRPAT
jgi:signal transduction histidine kinase